MNLQFEQADSERNGTRQNAAEIAQRNEDMNALALKARCLSVLMRDAFLYRTENGSGPAKLEPEVIEALTEGLYDLADITDKMCRMV